LYKNNYLALFSYLMSLMSHDKSKSGIFRTYSDAQSLDLDFDLLLNFYRATQLCYRGLGSRNFVCPFVRQSVCPSICHTRALWL